MPWLQTKLEWFDPINIHFMLVLYVSHRFSRHSAVHIHLISKSEWSSTILYKRHLEYSVFNIAKGRDQRIVHVVFAKLIRDMTPFNSKKYDKWNVLLKCLFMSFPTQSYFYPLASLAFIKYKSDQILFVLKLLEATIVCKIKYQLQTTRSSKIWMVFCFKSYFLALLFVIEIQDVGFLTTCQEGSRVRIFHLLCLQIRIGVHELFA